MTPTKRKRTNNINNKNNNNTPMIPSIPLQEPPTIIKERIKHITEELKKEYPDEKIELILESIGYPEKNDNAIFHTYIFNYKLYGSERIYSILYTIENRNYIPLKSSPLKYPSFQPVVQPPPFPLVAQSPYCQVAVKLSLPPS